MISVEELRARQPEADWLGIVVEAAEALGYRVYHTTFSLGSGAGYPDLTIVGRDGRGRARCLFVELKTQRGTVTPAQRDWLAWIADCGQEAYVWRPSDFEAALAILRGEEEEA